MAFGMSPFPLQFGSRGGLPAGRIRISDGGYVSCYEVKEAVYRAAATTLGISEAVQDIAWEEALMGGSRLFVPQSKATSVISGVAHCDLGEDPATNISYNSAQTACQAMGDGWAIISQAQWHTLTVISQAYWAGQSKANPTGNTEHGRSHAVTSEVGIRSDGLPVTGSSQGTYGRTLTGQRAVADGGGKLLAWSHDGTAGGVFDLVGCCYEWTSRARLVDWEIQVIPGSAGVQVYDATESTEWRAILADGTLVDPGTAGTLKYSTDSGIYLSTTQAGTGTAAMFKDVGAGAISPVPPLLIAMGLFPWSSSVPTVGQVITLYNGEMITARSGSWPSTSAAGLCSLVFTVGRTHQGSDFGFRPAFIPP